MKEKIDVFTKYCKEKFALDSVVEYNYHSLSVCLIDCIYSLRAKYFVVTIPIVDRYSQAFMRGDKYAEGDTLKDLLSHIDECGGIDHFVDRILKNHQKLGRNIPKEQVLVNFANTLIKMGINTMRDFQKYKDQEKLEMEIRSIPGLGDAAVNYIFMLAGDPGRCKPDVHIHRCLMDALGEDMSNDKCQALFQGTVENLQVEYPGLTVRQLDGIIWQEYQSKR